jgi:hypothetical protein
MSFLFISKARIHLSVGAEQKRMVRTLLFPWLPSELGRCAEETQNIIEICKNISGICRNINGICKNINDILSFFRTIVLFRRQWF